MAFTITVYSIHGSQFTAKVLAALQHRKIPHFVKAVPLDKAKRVKVIPSGGYLVPELKVVQDNGDAPGAPPLIVSDSEKILHWIDDNMTTTAADNKLYPTELASELSIRASSNKLAGFVWYYNWVHSESFHRSILQAFRNALPLASIVPNWLLQIPLKSERTKFRRQAARAILGEDGNANNTKNDDSDSMLDDEPRMRQILVDELEFFQSHLADDTQPYLVPGTTQPTAADFSVYPQLERLVGGTGAYDVDIPAAMPMLLEVQSLQRLWKWHERMQKECPVQFKGKSPPKP